MSFNKLATSFVLFFLLVSVSVFAASITPNPAYSNNDLTCSLGGGNPNAYLYSWTRNSQPQIFTSYTVPASATSVFDQWSCRIYQVILGKVTEFGTAAITVQNGLPITTITSFQNGTEGQTVINFTGTAFDPIDNDPINAWLWGFGDGNNAAGQNTAHTYLQDGTYTVTLSATDSNGGTGVDIVTVVIADTAPVVNFNMLPNPVVEGMTVNFTDLSSAYDGITAWDWDFDNDGTVDNTTQNATAFFDDGSYIVNLTVTDADGSVRSQIQILTVTDTAPTANFSVSNYSVTVGQQVDFTDLSIPAWDAITAWDWDIDGDAVVDYTTQNASHTYLTVGNYTVDFTVTDSDGSTDTATANVEVRSALLCNPPVSGDWIIAGTQYVYCDSVNLNFLDNIEVYNTATFILNNSILNLNSQFSAFDAAQISFQNTNIMNYVELNDNATITILNSASTNEVFVTDNTVASVLGSTLNQLTQWYFSVSTLTNSSISVLDLEDNSTVNFATSNLVDTLLAYALTADNQLITGTVNITGTVSIDPFAYFGTTTRQYPMYVSNISGLINGAQVNITDATNTLLYSGLTINGFIQPILVFNSATYNDTMNISVNGIPSGTIRLDSSTPMNVFVPTIVIPPTPQAPVITFTNPITPLIISVGQLAAFNITAMDPEGSALTVNWSINGTPAFGEIISNNSNSSFGNLFSVAGLYTVDVTVTDNQSLTDTFSWNVNVTSSATHDIDVSTTYINNVNGIRITNSTGSDIMSTNLSQGQTFTIRYRTDNIGTISENFNDTITVRNSTGGVVFTNTHAHLNRLPGSQTTDTDAWNTAGLPAGQYTVVVNASIIGFTDSNTVNNNRLRTVNLVAPTGDITPPVISNIQVIGITNQSAIINWTTDEPADSGLYYYINSTTWGVSYLGAFVTAHTVNTSTSLDPSTVYFYNITSCDISGNCAQVGPFNFTTLSNTNTAPNATIISPVAGQFQNGTAITFNGTGLDTEDGALSGASLVWTSNLNGIIGTGNSFTLSTLSIGNHTIVLTATDSGTLTDNDTVLIEVRTQPTNNQPAFTTAPINTNIHVGTPFNANVAATDANVPPQVLTFSDNIAQFNINPTTGNINFTPAVIGPIAGTIRVCDNSGFANNCSTQAFNLAVTNAAPILQTIGNKVLGEGQTLTINMNATDADGDSLVNTTNTLPAGATFVGGTFSWTPSFTQSGTYTVRFNTTDGYAIDSETITVTVNNVPQPGFVSGYIFDNLGAGIVGATVDIKNGALTVASTTTIAGGAYTVGALQGTYGVLAYATGYQNNLVNGISVVEFQTTPHNKTLQPIVTTGNLNGTVTSGGNTIYGATVQLRSGAIVIASTTTDAQGRYAFSNININSYTLLTTKAGFTDNSQAVSIAAGTTTRNVALSAAGSSGIISGQVLDGTNGVTGIQTTVTITKSTGEVVQIVQTDVNGNYQINGLPASVGFTYNLNAAVVSPYTMVFGPQGIALASGQTKTGMNIYMI